MPVKIMLMIKRKPGLTPEQFRHHYENSHSRIGLKYFGHLWVAYRRNYLGAGGPLESEAGLASAGQSCPYDAIAEVYYRDMAALEENNRLMGDPVIGKLVREDEARLFDRPNCWAVITEEIVEEPIWSSAMEGNANSRAMLAYAFPGTHKPN